MFPIWVGADVVVTENAPVPAPNRLAPKDADNIFGPEKDNGALIPPLPLATDAPKNPTLPEPVENGPEKFELSLASFPNIAPVETPTDPPR
jgi:hypothetical protein